MPVQLEYLGEALVTLVAVEGQRVDSHMNLQKIRCFKLQETDAAPCWSLFLFRVLKVNSVLFSVAVVKVSYQVGGVWFADLCAVPQHILIADFALGCCAGGAF